MTAKPQTGGYQGGVITITMLRFLLHIKRKMNNISYRFEHSYLQQIIFHYYRHTNVIYYYLTLYLEIIIVHKQDANNNDISMFNGNGNLMYYIVIASKVDVIIKYICIIKYFLQIV